MIDKQSVHMSSRCVSCLVLSCLVLSCLVLSCLVLSCVRQDPEMLTNIHREVVIMQHLYHQNIIRIHDVLESQEYIYVILE
jgi:serine/threonine protein kinase